MKHAPFTNLTHAAVERAALPPVKKPQMPAHTKPDAERKKQVAITIDLDVFQAVTDTAKAQRDSFSGMANRMLATMCGLIPRKADRCKPLE